MRLRPRMLPCFLRIKEGYSHLGLDQELVLLIVISGLVGGATEGLVQLGHNGVAGRVESLKDEVL